MNAGYDPSSEFWPSKKPAAIKSQSGSLAISSHFWPVETHCDHVIPIYNFSCQLPQRFYLQGKLAGKVATHWSQSPPPMHLPTTLLQLYHTGNLYTPVHPPQIYASNATSPTLHIPLHTPQSVPCLLCTTSHPLWPTSLVHPSQLPHFSHPSHTILAHTCWPSPALFWQQPLSCQPGTKTFCWLSHWLWLWEAGRKLPRLSI